MNDLAWKKTAQAAPFVPTTSYPGVSAQPAEADATFAIWHDPSSYDPFTHGPPYLPGQRVGPVAGPHRLATKLAFSAGVELPSVLVLLRALSTIHQTNHWVTSGASFYGDHLLFERLYETVTEEVDKVAERALGSGASKDFLNPVLQSAMVARVIGSLCPTSTGETAADLVRASHSAESTFLQAMKKVVDIMKARGTLSRGTDDLLASIEDAHEGHIYLLGQRLQEEPNGEVWKAPASL